eukprot:CAMPEP_0206256282 /NCGR_PEP_ID=MMETSP0047_2-20121206/24686_1 /ASSEMBLY_ACC=CAM_ASM_000192 /TAXON_ID=195065 /ORGANISM="Chroomonas mesostigmatica_cf, Strain CCMP1168" /LENGTH=53 /DNA_ID=CAMNT_0053682715 /DNA_START=125 /DNA_END=282 /DNA_ORIENTATION=+
MAEKTLLCCFPGQGRRSGARMLGQALRARQAASKTVSNSPPIQPRGRQIVLAS